MNHGNFSTILVCGKAHTSGCVGGDELVQFCVYGETVQSGLTLTRTHPSNGGALSILSDTVACGRVRETTRTQDIKELLVGPTAITNGVRYPGNTTTPMLKGRVEHNQACRLGL